MREIGDRGRGLRESIGDSLRRLLVLLVLIAMFAAGIALSLLASFPTTTIVAAGVSQGVAPPGNSIVPLNQTEHSFAVFEADLPCPLFVYPLTGPEHQRYLDGGTLPPLALNCDNPSAVKTEPATHLLLRNVHSSESFGFRVEWEFSRTALPHAWLAIPGLALLASGALPLMVLLMVRGMGRLSGALAETTNRRQKENK